MAEQTLSAANLSDPCVRRQVFLDIALRRARPGTGSALSLLREHVATRNWPDLTSILVGIRWAVVGGVATRTYMPERVTQDLDILIARSDAPKVHSRLQSGDLVYVQDLSIGGTVWRTPEGVLLYIIESSEPWVGEGLDQTRTDPQGLPVLSLPYLVLMKVMASRTQDLADASRMLGLASGIERQATREAFARWWPSALEDLESLIALGELETGIEST